jgi:CRISPR-associated exonuclease Cas4
MANRFKDDELLLLSGIQHFAFCRRQWALIHIEQQWEENLLTFGGRSLHERADDPFFTESRGAILVTRSLPLVSYQLGLYGIADVVEFHQSEEGVELRNHSGLWRPNPIEYKYGEPKSDDRDMVQLCAQAICLEEMLGANISEGNVFYGRIRRRQHVDFDVNLRRRVSELASEMHQLFEQKVTPPPEQEESCKRCSLVEVCLPLLNQRRSVRRYLEKSLHETN